MKNTIIGFIVIILFLGLCGGAYYFAFYESTEYYTQIDNTKIEKIEDDDFKYKYTLKCYDNEGKEKEISFETTRELRETAYIKIKYMLTRGVINWEEVMPENLPEKVKNKYE